jgi:molybdate transport system substrate-binding protein
MRFLRTARFLSVWLVLVLVSACGGSATPTPTNATGATPTSAGGATSPGQSTPRVVRGEVTVFAAASLNGVFNDLAKAFEERYPEAKVVFTFAGSSQLRTQLGHGAKADVFASADWKNMQGAQQDGTIASEPHVFARNSLVIAVPADDPAGIASLQDLAKPGLRLVLVSQEVPIGAYARQVLAKASQDPQYGSDFADRVLKNAVSEETDVRAALTKVSLGEADAAFVYRTDALAPGARDKVKVVEIPAPFNVVAEYPIAVVKGAPNPAGAQAFIDFVLSDDGQRILRQWGFETVQ